MRRSAISVASNIAEGQAHMTTKDFLHFISIAQGSRAELEAQIIIANRLGYIEEEKAEQLLEVLAEIAKMLYTLSSALNVSGNRKTREQATNY